MPCTVSKHRSRRLSTPSSHPIQESLQGPPQAPWGHLPAYGPELAYEWGWAPPPKVYVKRAHLRDGLWREVPFCRHRRRKGFKVRACGRKGWACM